MSEPGTVNDRVDPTQVTPPRRRRTWLRPLLYLVIFASGGIVGAGTTLLAIRGSLLHAVHHPDEMPARITARMATSLSLSDEQAREVESILRERQEALQSIRREYQPRIEEELDRVETQVSQVLDEKQRDQWRSRFDHLRQTWVPEVPPGDD